MRRRELTFSEGICDAVWSREREMYLTQGQQRGSVAFVSTAGMVDTVV